MTTETKQKFSEQELDLLKEIETASHFREMVNSRGWELFLELKDLRIAQIEQQVLRSKLDKEALYVTQLRCQGIVEFMGAIIEGINTSVETLDPAVLERMLRATIVNKADLDGELGLEELP